MRLKLCRQHWFQFPSSSVHCRPVLSPYCGQTPALAGEGASTRLDGWSIVRSAKLGSSDWQLSEKDNSGSQTGQRTHLCNSLYFLTAIDVDVVNPTIRKTIKICGRTSKQISRGPQDRPLNSESRLAAPHCTSTILKFWTSVVTRKMAGRSMLLGVRVFHDKT